MTRRRFVFALLLGILACAAPFAAGADFTADEQTQLRERFRSASPAERRALRREFRARFRRASPAERRQMREFVRESRMLGAEARERETDAFDLDATRSVGDVVDRYQSASPEEQQEIRRRLESHLSQLPPHQRRRAMRQLRKEFKRGTQEEFRALEGDLGGLSAGEKRRLRQHVKQLPPDERRALMQRLGRYRSLSEADQQALRERFSAYRSLPEEDRDRLRRNASRFRAMPEADRERLRNALRELRELPPDEREALLEEMLTE